MTDNALEFLYTPPVLGMERLTSLEFPEMSKFLLTHQRGPLNRLSSTSLTTIYTYMSSFYEGLHRNPSPLFLVINLGGYTKGARNDVLAARPSPIQIQLMGYAGTLGAGYQPFQCCHV